MVIVGDYSEGTLVSLSEEALKNKENIFRRQLFTQYETEILLRVRDRYGETFYASIDGSKIRGGINTIPENKIPFKIVLGKNYNDLVIITMDEEK